MMRTFILTTAVASILSLPVLAQETKDPAPAAGTAMTAPADRAVVLTAEQAKNWVGKPVFSSDGKNIGEVAAFARGADSKVSEMHADIGGFLGIGETRVKLIPTQFKLSGDRVTIDMTAAQAKDLPRVN